MFLGFLSKATAALVVIKLSATFAEATFLSRSPQIESFTFFWGVFTFVLFFSRRLASLWKPLYLMFAHCLCVSWTFGTFSCTLDI